MEQHIRDAGCVPAFKNYRPEGYPLPFPSTVCISPNEVVVHGVPANYVLQDGDLLTIDVGTEYKGYFTDSARSRVIGSNERAQKLVDATESILMAQLSVVKNNCDFLLMVRAAEQEAHNWGVHILPQFGGHGIREQIHMDPFIPSTIDRSKNKLTQRIQERQLERQKLTAGQTICVEPVVTFGDSRIIVDEDQWTVRKADGELTAHSERCLLVTEEGYELLS